MWLPGSKLKTEGQQSRSGGLFYYYNTNRGLPPESLCLDGMNEADTITLTNVGQVLGLQYSTPLLSPMAKPKKPKLYCYVDETGQDTYGNFFIVSVVVTGDVRESLVARLEQIEKASGKGNVKWTNSRSSFRVAY